MRPVYERQSDKANETLVVGVLSSLGYNVCELGRFSPCDFFLQSPTNTAYLAEYKRRSHNYGDFPTVIIPESKLRKCLTLAETLKVGFLYVVEFNDGLYGAVVRDYSTTIGGRYDRGDPLDIVRMAHIPVEDFRRIR